MPRRMDGDTWLYLHFFLCFLATRKFFLDWYMLNDPERMSYFLPQYLGICCFFKVDDEVTGIWSLQGKIIAVWWQTIFCSLFLSNEERWPVVAPRSSDGKIWAGVCFQGRLHGRSLYTSYTYRYQFDLETFVNTDVFLRKYPANCATGTHPYSSCTQFWAGFTEHAYLSPCYKWCFHHSFRCSTSRDASHNNEIYRTLMTPRAQIFACFCWCHC